MKPYLLVTFLGASLAALGCGGGSATPYVGGSCPTTFTPCGGNLVGTWRIKADCISTSSSSSSSCPGMSTSLAPGSSYSASITFGANGTLTETVSGNMTETISYPPACLGSDAGATQACADYSKRMQSALAQVGDAGSTPIQSITFSCSANSSGTCVCNEGLTYKTYSFTGSYAVSGTKIMITALSGPGMPDGGVGDAGTNAPTDYCVSGKTLMIMGTSSSGSSSSSTVIVLTK